MCFLAIPGATWIFSPRCAKSWGLRRHHAESWGSPINEALFHTWKGNSIYYTKTLICWPNKNLSYIFGQPFPAFTLFPNASLHAHFCYFQLYLKHLLLQISTESHLSKGWICRSILTQEPKWFIMTELLHRFLQR